MRALVVDDELAVQKLIVRGLTQQGFTCDAASDGLEAEAHAAKNTYDAVVTDLRMPNKHGHALAMQLLELNPRPVIVVHTGIMEPKLAKDLLARGVDDILFKPCELSLLAVKVKALVDRRQIESAPRNDSEGVPEELQATLEEQTPAGAVVSLASLESKLSGLSRILPLSAAGLEVYNMTSTGDWDSTPIAAAIQRDAALTAEVLRLANSAFYNTSGQRIQQLERAVVQIGQKRIGEFALASNALTALTSGVVSWMNVDLTWKRSMAAGVAIEMLIDEGKHQQVEQGLLLSATMHPLGRIVLGSLYPKQYETMIENCGRYNEPLIEQERGVFPLNHAEVLAYLLESWGIPGDIHEPLRHSLAGYVALNQLPEPLRLRAELVALSIFLGDLAIGQWEAWDVIELPPPALLKKLRITKAEEIISNTKWDVEQLAVFRVGRSAGAVPSSSPPPSKVLAYCDLSGSPCDFLGEIITSMGIGLKRISEGELSQFVDNILINCVGVAPQRLASSLRGDAHRKIMLVTDAERATGCAKYGRTIAMPASYGQLRAACFEIASQQA